MVCKKEIKKNVDETNFFSIIWEIIKISHRATRTKEEESGTATLQKRLFGRKNSQNDPLPVVLLSYKADYDEILPQGLSRNGAVYPK